MAMAEENISQVKEMITDKNCCFDDAKPMKIIEETMPLMDEEIVGDDDVVLLPPPALSNGVIIPETTSHVNSRRNSTGGLDKRAPGKSQSQSQAQAQTRYRGNQMGSTHDLCKHGKRREDDLVIKPWKLVKKKNAEVGGDLGKVETLSVTKKSLGNVAKSKAASEAVKSSDGLRVKRSETKSTTTPSDSAVETKREAASEIVKSGKTSETKSSTTPREVKKTNLGVTKIPRISENKSSKEDLLKNLKNKEKKKEKIDEPVDVVEKTLYVVESSIEEDKKIKKKESIKSVKSEIQQSSDKKILRSSVKKSPSLLPSLSPSSKVVKETRLTKSDPRPIRQTTTTTSRSKTGLSSEKKGVSSANLVTNSKTESKIKPKRIGLKVTPPPLTRQVSFKKGKILEPKPEDSTSTLMKFKKRVVQEPKLRSDGYKKKKILKDKRAINTINGEGKREKVVLRHRKVEAKKKLQTLFNNVIEETVNKLEEVRKSKVKALVGAFETVISLQDDKTKTSQKKKKTQSKSISSLVVEGG